MPRCASSGGDQSVPAFARVDALSASPTAAALAARGAHVVLAVRNLEKGKGAARRIEEATPGADVELPVGQSTKSSMLEMIAALRSGSGACVWAHAPCACHRQTATSALLMQECKRRLSEGVFIITLKR